VIGDKKEQRFSLITHHPSLITVPMRLDLFLKASRLVPRRTVAQALCDGGAVSINGVPAKSSRPIKVGDEIKLRRRNHLLDVRVLAVPASRQTSRSDSSSLYQMLSDVVLSEDPLD
jgi:ribosomal 50S subunit-recycling heat shock protein